ncbi:MAG: AAA family ATPase, partial [Kiritimatiellae bacterium]|nr:AAA family ATPase [Kiritimatiellia bacterium]
GCSGTGKTCLLKEIESAVKSRNDGRKVEYIEVYGFFRAYVNALENKAMEDFRAKWESLDVLLLDGFEFLEDCHGISEEMLRLVDGFINSGRQLVIATSADLSALQDDCMARLYNRVRSGVVAELKMPEQGLREACVRSAAKARGVSLPEKTVQEIARKKENFWVLNGLVNSAIAEMS